MDKGTKNLHSGHRSRVREKIKKGGLSSMHDHELLEYLLFHTIPQRDTNVLSHKLIDRFGSFHGVLNATYDDLLQVEGVTEITAIFLSSFPTIFDRYNDDFNNIRKIETMEDIDKLMRMKFLGETVENMYMIFLDSDNNFLSLTLLARGSSREVSINKRKIMEAVIRSNAEKVIIAHNHPNNVQHASADDIEATVLLGCMLEDLGIHLVDSVIYANGHCFSMLEKVKKIRNKKR